MDKNRYFPSIPPIFFFPFLLLIFLYLANNPTQGGGSSTPSSSVVVTRKLLHKNGLKEFTVQKNIKGNECACACFCSLPNSTEALAQLRSAAPNDDFAQLIRPTRQFEIEKEIRGNQCRCKCACAEPEYEQQQEPIGVSDQIPTNAIPSDKSSGQRDGEDTGDQQVDNKVEEANGGEAIAAHPTSNMPPTAPTTDGTSPSSIGTSSSAIPSAITETNSKIKIVAPKTSDPQQQQQQQSTVEEMRTTTTYDSGDEQSSPPTARSTTTQLSTESESTELPATSVRQSTSVLSTNRAPNNVQTGGTLNSSPSAQIPSNEAQQTTIDGPSTQGEQRESTGTTLLGTEGSTTTIGGGGATTIEEITNNTTNIVESKNATNWPPSSVPTNSEDKKGQMPEGSTTEQLATTEESTLGENGTKGLTTSSSSSHGSTLGDALDGTTMDEGETSKATSAGKEDDEKEEGENSTTFDPLFKARVANLLNNLKEQLFKLRQQQQGQGGENGNGTKKKEEAKKLDEAAEEKKEEKQLFFQIDQEIQQKNGGNGGESQLDSENKKEAGEIGGKEMELTKSRTTPPATLPTTSSSSSGAQKQIEISSTSINPKPSGASTNTLPRSSSSSVPRQTETSLTENQKHSQLPSTSPSQFSEVVQSEEQQSTVTEAAQAFVTGDGTEDSVESGENIAATPSTETAQTGASLLSTFAPNISSSTTTIVNPIFKARVANLLNQLKEQLYRLRKVQQQQNGTVGILSEGAHPPPSASSSSSSSPINNSSENLTKSEQMLQGLQSKLEQLRAKTEMAENALFKHVSNASNISKNGSHVFMASKDGTIPLTTNSSSSSSTTAKTPITSSSTAPSTSSSSTSTSAALSSTSSTTSTSSTSTTSIKTTPPLSQPPKIEKNPVIGQSKNLLSANGEKISAGEKDGFAFVTEAPEEMAENGGPDENYILNGTTGPTIVVFILNETNGIDGAGRGRDGGAIVTNGTTETTTTTTSASKSIPLNTTPIDQAEEVIGKGHNKLVDNLTAPMMNNASKEGEAQLLFPLAPNDFLVDLPPKNVTNGNGDDVDDEEKRNRVILLPAPPNGRAFFMATVSSRNAPSVPSSANDDGATTEGMMERTRGRIIQSSSSTIPTQQSTKTISQVSPENDEEEGGTKAAIIDDYGDLTRGTTSTKGATATRLEKGPNGGKPKEAKRKKLIAPQAQTLIDRLEQARKLREEQVKLEMMEAIRQEQLGLTEPDPLLAQRRREIEQRLLQLAQAERVHREMLERQRMGRVGEEEEEASQGTSEQYPSRSSPAIPAVNCDPVRRFIRLFHISSPLEWIDQNCQFARRHFPNASCDQIGTLLMECVKEDGMEEEGENDRRPK